MRSRPREYCSGPPMENYSGVDTLSSENRGPKPGALFYGLRRLSCELGCFQPRRRSDTPGRLPVPSRSNRSRKRTGARDDSSGDQFSRHRSRKRHGAQCRPQLSPVSVMVVVTPVMVVMPMTPMVVMTPVMVTVMHPTAMPVTIGPPAVMRRVVMHSLYRPRVGGKRHHVNC